MNSTEDNQKQGVTEGGKKFDVFEGVDPEIKIRTKKMMMWFILFAVIMIFGGLTSAMIVMNSNKIWMQINPPTWLLYSNIIIIISSLVFIFAIRSLRKGKQKAALYLTVITLLLGLAFAYTQNRGWKEMAGKGMGYTISKNAQGLDMYSWNRLSRITGEYGKDFWFELDNEKVVKEGDEFYKPSDPSKPVTDLVMNTFNAGGAMLFILVYVHIIHLVFGLIYLVVNAVRISKGRLNSGNWISLHVNGMYWHFLGILWLYLFAFVFYIF